MKHCASAGKSWRIALLEYLATPLSTGIPSPAAMMGRDFRGLLPHLQYFLPDSTEELLVHHHENQVRSGGHDLPGISVGSNVTFLDHRSGEWYPAKVQNRESHSYILTTEQGCTIFCNCIDIRPTNVPFHLQTSRVERCFPVGTKDPVARTPRFLKSAPYPVPKSNPKPNVPSSNISHSTPVTRNIVKTHSGHVIKPPNKLNL